MELMKNKLLAISIICFCLLSCHEKKEDNNSNQVDTQLIQGSDSCQTESNQEANFMRDTTKVDSVNVEQKKKIELPDFIDYESVYQLRYEYYINKAYDKTTYERNYKPYSYQSKHLDSLIDIYEKKKENSE